jgi:hypothetical protein
MTDKDTVMATGKARWLLEGGIDELDEEERALLLALVRLEADTGRTLTDDEREALDQILARTGADGEGITRAVKHIVDAKAQDNRRLDWSALKARLRRK